MTREEAISVLEESKRQNEIMRDNPNTFFNVSDIVAGERNAQKRIDAIHMAISALRQQETVTKCNDLFDEDGGEIPLNAKTMTLDDAIAHLDDTLSDTGRKWSCKSCRMEHVQLREWLAELRYIKRERNAPLTLDELRKMEGEPVWVVYDEDAGMWALVEVLEESIFLTNNLGGRSEYAADVELEDDGITVYRRKPEEDDCEH